MKGRKERLAKGEVRFVPFFFQALPLLPSFSSIPSSFLPTSFFLFSTLLHHFLFFLFFFLISSFFFFSFFSYFLSLFLLLSFSSMASIDPELLRISPAEGIFVALEAALFLFNFCLLGFVVANRHYPPLKIKQIRLVVASLFGLTGPFRYFYFDNLLI